MSDSDQNTGIQHLVEDTLWTTEQIQRLAGLMGLQPGRAFLDVGCGTGYLMRRLGTFVLPGGQVFGLERDKQAAETAKSLADRMGFEDFRVFHGEAEALPFGDGSFDLTAAHNFLGFVEKPGAVLDEMIRVTKPGGMVALFEPASDTADLSWTNAVALSLEERLIDRECAFRMSEGRAREGEGRVVGSLVPGWLEMRGLVNVNVRANEKVAWIAPPYRSPDQKKTYEQAIAHADRDDREALRRAIGYLEAGGGDGELVRAFESLWEKSRAGLAKGLADESVSLARSQGHLWCIWGMVPPPGAEVDLKPPRS